MAKLLDSGMKKAVWEQIRLKGADPLTEKEIEQLVILLRSEAMIKALAQVYNSVRAIPVVISKLNLASPDGTHRAIILQGEMEGFTDAIDSLLSLITVEEDEEEANE